MFPKCQRAGEAEKKKKHRKKSSEQARATTTSFFFFSFSQTSKTSFPSFDDKEKIVCEGKRKTEYKKKKWSERNRGEERNEVEVDASWSQRFLLQSHWIHADTRSSIDYAPELFSLNIWSMCRHDANGPARWRCWGCVRSHTSLEALELCWRIEANSDRKLPIYPRLVRGFWRQPVSGQCHLTN